MVEACALCVNIKGSSKSGLPIIKMKDFYRSFKRFIRNEPEYDVSEGLHAKIIESFNEMMVDAMYKRLYIFKMPFGIGELCVGEEINKRKYIKKLVEQEDGTFKRQFMPNTGLRPTFRFWWNKATSKGDGMKLYYLYMCQKNSKALYHHATEHDIDPLKKNYRAHIIYRAR